MLHVMWRASLVVPGLLADSDTAVEMAEMRQLVVPVLEAYGVDLVVAGHSHDYQRR